MKKLKESTMSVQRDDKVLAIVERALRAHESHLSDIQILEAELGQIREVYESHEDLIQIADVDMEPVPFPTKAKHHTSLQLGEIHQQYKGQIDLLQQRISSLEAKNKEYLDRLANPTDEDRKEMLRATKEARKSVTFMQEVTSMEKLVDETLEELLQKEGTIDYLKSELDAKLAELDL